VRQVGFHYKGILCRLAPSDDADTHLFINTASESIVIVTQHIPGDGLYSRYNGKLHHLLPANLLAVSTNSKMVIRPHFDKFTMRPIIMNIGCVLLSHRID
jgi:hypothetical protein